MGSDDINIASSQRMETALNSHRLYQAEHPLQYRCAPPVVSSRRGDSGRKARPAVVGRFVESGGKLYPPNDRERYLHQQQSNFRNGIYGAEDGRHDGIVVESDGRRGAVNVNMNVNMSMNGGLQMRGMVSRNTGGRASHQDWGERVSGSQSEGSDDDDDDDDDDGDAEMDGEVDGMVSVDGRHDSMAGNGNPNANPNANNSGSNAQGGSEGFQKSGLDREGGMSKAALQNHPPSLGMFLSPPFMNSFGSPSGGPPMLDAAAAQNGGGGVPASSGYYRDGLLKESGLSRDSPSAGSLNEHHIGRISHGPSIHHEGGLPVGSVADSDHYYTQLLQSSGPLAQKDGAVDEGGTFVERKGAAATAETSEPSLRNILSDPLTGALMDDAAILSCGHSFGSGGLQHVLEARACFTCGQPVTNDSVSPNHALRAAVQAYRREEEFQSMSSKSAKRRKFEQDRAGFSDPMDYCRGRGVQFPFVVSDRVIIKGNKRTPERFVGREAVITTQCLNGWYVVKTLDNAESVKLQYRSLLKVGDHQSSNEISQKALGPTWL